MTDRVPRFTVQRAASFTILIHDIQAAREPKLTIKEKINLEIYTERQNHAAERERYLSQRVEKVMPRALESETYL